MVAKKKTTRKTAKAEPIRKSVASPKVAKAEGGWWGNSFTASGALMTVAAVVGILAFFVCWVGDHFLSLTISINGIDLLTASSDDKSAIFSNSWQNYIPLITMILSAVIFIALILPVFKLKTNRIATDIIVTILGIVMFILSISFLYGQCHLGDLLDGKFVDYLCEGFYMTLIPSLIFIIFGVKDAIESAL